MTKMRGIVIGIMILICLIPLYAQELDEQSILEGDQIVSGIFQDANATAHEWQLDVEANDIIALHVRRIGGVFTPRVLLVAPDGADVTPTTDFQDDYSQQVVFQDGLDVSGQYQVLVLQENPNSDGVLAQSEYSLQVDYRGQTVTDPLEGLDPLLPTTDETPLPDFFVDPVDIESFPTIPLYGEPVVSQADALLQPNLYTITGSRTIELNNSNAVGRLISRIAITDDGIALEMTTGAVIVGDADISNLSVEGSVLTVAFTNDRTIVTDFYNISQIIVDDNLVVVRLLDDQLIILDEDRINLQRQGGITGEGPNAEPIHVFDLDGVQLRTDAQGWHTLSTANDQLVVVYDEQFRIESQFSEGILLASDETERVYSVTLTTPNDQPLVFDIDPTGFRGLLVQNNIVSAQFVDDFSVREQLDNVTRMTVDNQAINVLRRDNTRSVILADRTRIDTPAEIIRDGSALPNEDTFLPQNFNNLGTTLSDYHPQLAMDFATIPVNRVLGNFVYPVEDYAVQGGGLALNWSRTYNSMASNSLTPDYLLNATTNYPTIGSQWRHQYQIELDVTYAPLGEVTLLMADGSRHIFEATGASNTQFRSDVLRSFLLIRDGDFSGNWIAYDLDGVQYHFDPAGRLTRMADAQGSVLLFSPIPEEYRSLDDGGFFVTDGYGRRLEVYTDSVGLIKTVREVQGRTITYSYNDENQLTEVDYFGADYNANYIYENSYLSQIDDVNSPYAQQMTLDYDDDGRVTQYRLYPDTLLESYYELTYDNRVSTETLVLNEGTADEDNRTSTFRYDLGYRLTEWILPERNWSYQWVYAQGTGSLIEISLPTRARIQVAYDEFGYLSRFTDPLFGSSFGSYEFVYNNGVQDIRLLTAVHAPTVENWLTLAYDNQNRVVAVDRALSGSGESRISHTTEYEYYVNTTKSYLEGQLASVIDRANGLITAYDYDEFGYPNSIRLGTLAQIETNDPARRWQLVHDAVGRLLSINNESDVQTTIQWNLDREYIQQIQVGDWVYRYDYDLQDNLIAQTNPRLAQQYTYDNANRMIGVADVLDRVTTYQYDAAGNVASVILPDGERTIAYTYDRLNNLTSITSPAGFVTRYAVDLNQESNRTIYTVTNPLGEQTQYYFDPLGRLRLVTDLDDDGDQIFQYALNYGVRGGLNEIIDGRGRRLTVSTDFQGNVLSTGIADVVFNQYAYTNNGKLAQLTDPIGNVVSYTYDPMGHLASVTLPDGLMREFDYGVQGNLTGYRVPVVTEETDEGDNTTTLEYRYEYDVLNQLKTAIDPLGHVTRYRYDASGNLVAIYPSDNNTVGTEFVYDEAQHLVEWAQVDGDDRLTTQYIYDLFDNLTAVIEPNGLRTDFAYDLSDNVVALTQPEDREFIYGYDALGRVTTETNPLGQTELYAYNVIGQIVRINSPNGNTQSFNWFGNGRLARYAEANGVEFEYISDSLGRLTDIVDLGNDEATAVNSRFVYDANGNIVTVRQGNRALITGNDATLYRYTYDALGRVATYLPPDSDVPYQFFYDELGNRTQVIDPDGVETHYTYDAVGNIITELTYVGTSFEQMTEFTYDAQGNVIEARSSDGVVREYQYNNFNQLVTVTEIVDGNTQTAQTRQFEYDNAGNVSRLIDASGQETVYRYDLFGNLLLIEQSGTVGDELVTQSTRYTYDSIDNLVQIQQSGGQTINMTYNGSGQRVRYIDATDNSWSYSYDASGNLTQLSDPLGNSQRYLYDAGNRISSITFEQGAVTQFTYDGLGNLSRVLLPITASVNSREQIDYRLNSAGALVSVTHGSQTVSNFERSDDGLIESFTTPAGETVRITYNELGLISNIATVGYNVDRIYDTSGRVTEINSVGIGNGFEYDGFGHVVRSIQTQFPLTDAEITLSDSRYSYDVAGNLTSRSSLDGQTMLYQYDIFGQPIQLELGNESINVEYNTNGWRTQITRSNDIETRYTYDANGRIRNVVHLAGTERFDGFAYEYDSIGNIIRVTRTDNWAILYSYDSARQLISERWLNDGNQVVYSVNYAYDNAGNRTEKTERSETGDQTRTVYQYNNRNQVIAEFRDAGFDLEDRFSLPLLVTVVISLPLLWFVRRRPRWMPIMLVIVPISVPLFQSAQVPDVVYGYNENGNLTSEISDDGQIIYEYDPFNRLTSVEQVVADGDENAVISSIQYDALGRINTIRDGETNFEFDYDAYGLVTVRETANGQTITYRYFSVGDAETLLIDVDDTAFWTLDDGLGQISRFVTDSGDTFPNESGFHVNAFGEIVVPYDMPDGVSLPNRNMVEQLHLSNANITLMGVRAYHPALGRFLQRDWVRHDPRGNLYTYAYNSPTNYQDPTGLTAEAAFAGIDPDISTIDPASYVLQPSQLDVPEPPDVAQRQSDEMHRLLSLAYAVQYGSNDMTVGIDENLCDIYLRSLNPIHTDARLAMGQPLRDTVEMYNSNAGWIPSGEPELGQIINPLADLETIISLLSQEQYSGTAFQSCDESLVLPMPNMPQTATMYQALHSIRDLLDEVPLYSAVASSLPTLTEDLVTAIITPQIEQFQNVPAILPESSGEIEALRDDTRMFFMDVLLPQVAQQPFRWQSLFQAQDIAPNNVIRIND